MPTEEPLSPVAQQIRAWFEAARPTPHDAFAKLDEVRARGLITRDEYIELLDTEL